MHDHIRRQTIEQRIQRFPRTITLLARGSKGDVMPGLHESVERAPDVAAAIARGQVVVVRTVEPTAQVAQPPAPLALDPTPLATEPPAETPPDAPAETKTRRGAPRSEVS